MKYSYLRRLRRPFPRAVVEAWDWLANHGLMALKTWRERAMGLLTKRGESVAADPNGLATMAATARHDVDLHPSIVKSVRRRFMLGDCGLTALVAMRAVLFSRRRGRLRHRFFSADPAPITTVSMR
jgi:hypothetical protein